jgi:hypothetical protein
MHSAQYSSDSESPLVSGAPAEPSLSPLSVLPQFPQTIDVTCAKAR